MLDHPNHRSGEQIGPKETTMPVDLDAHIRLADLRLRVLSGETPSAMEMRELLLDLQRGRDMTAAASAAQRRRVARETRAATKQRPPVDIDELFASPIAQEAFTASARRAAAIDLTTLFNKEDKQ
jgi:hypothetical protein